MRIQSRDHTPIEFLPASVNEQAGVVRSVATTMTDEDLAWISQNRDFAESERYKSKDDVDRALLESAIVTQERRRIESLFSNSDPIFAAQTYTVTLVHHLRALSRLFASALVNPTNPTQGYDAFWREALPLSDLDNAHAMYLSSDNWSFSVFHALVGEMADLASDDPNTLNSILTAGIQDCRTCVYSMLGMRYKGLSRLEFVSEVRRHEDWVRQNGVMPLFAYKAATEGFVYVTSLSEDLRAEYEQAAGRLEASLTGSEKERFRELRVAYQRLYAVRAAYDIWEYFGFYAFARHLMILRTCRWLETKSEDLAKQFHRCASTYLFSEASELMAI